MFFFFNFEFNDVTAGTVVASKALVVDSNKDVGTIRNLTIDVVFTDGNYTFDTSGNVSGLGTVGCGAITSTGNLAVTGTITGDTSLTLDTTTITTAEIGVLDSVTAGTAAASKALVLDSNKDVGTIRNLTIDGVLLMVIILLIQMVMYQIRNCWMGAITATGISSVGDILPTSAGGAALGSNTGEWSDLYLADGGVIYFGNDQEIRLSYIADNGLILKKTIH